MRQKICLSGCLLVSLLSAVHAQHYELSEHSLPGSSVKTYHVKCQAGGFGLIRSTTDAQPNTQLCMGMQTGVNQHVCLPLKQRKQSDVVLQLAKSACV